MQEQGYILVDRAMELGRRDWRATGPANPLPYPRIERFPEFQGSNLENVLASPAYAGAQGRSGYLGGVVPLGPAGPSWTAPSMGNPGPSTGLGWGYVPLQFMAGLPGITGLQWRGPPPPPGMPPGPPGLL